MPGPVVFRSANVEAVIGSPAGGEPGPIRLVTFESIVGAKRAGTNKLFGAPLVDKFGIGILHVVPRSTNWYQYPEMDDCLAAVAERVTPAAIGYGSSMGGYAVAHFLDRLGLDLGICLSPQVSIQRAVAPFETRWGDVAAATKFLTDDALPPRRGKLWLFADPHHQRDMAHVAAIAAAGPHQVVGVPHAGHTTARVLADGGSLSRIVKLFLDGQADADAIAALIAAGADSAKVLVNRARELDGAEREALLRRALEMTPGKWKAISALGRHLLEAGKVDEAQAVMAVIAGGRSKERQRESYRKICRQAGVAPVHLAATSTPTARRER